MLQANADVLFTLFLDLSTCSSANMSGHCKSTQTHTELENWIPTEPTITKSSGEGIKFCHVWAVRPWNIPRCSFSPALLQSWKCVFDPLLGWRSACGCQQPHCLALHSSLCLSRLQTLFQIRSFQVWFSSETSWTIQQLIPGVCFVQKLCTRFGLFSTMSVWASLGTLEQCKDKALQGGPRVRSKSYQGCWPNSVIGK